MESCDVFLAYHGTYTDNGSVQKAKDLFFFLQSCGVQCYFFPNVSSAYFAETPVYAQKSRKFLLVCNSNVDLKQDGTIANNGVYQEITSFWNCIYDGRRERGDARVFVYGGFDTASADKLHLAFQGVAHFDGNGEGEERCFDAVLRWIKGENMADSVFSRANDNDSFEFSGISSELKKAFVRRSVMNKMWNLTQMVSVARRIECLGISNNEMTMNMDEAVLKRALENNAEIELLFLRPRSRFVRIRENEEKQERNTIRNNTDASISFTRRLKNSASNGVYNNLRIYVYDLLPRVNMIFIDGAHLLLQYYANTIPGASNPCFYIKRLGDNQLFDFYYDQYTRIKSISKEIF